MHLNMGNDCADVQVPVRPAVQAVTDAGSKGIIHRRMAQSARDTDRTQTAIGIEISADAHHCIQLEQSQGDGRVSQIHFALLQLISQRLWQGLYVDFEPYRQGCCRADPGAHAPKLLSFNGFMKFKLSSPEILITECIKAEDLFA